MDYEVESYLIPKVNLKGFCLVVCGEMVDDGDDFDQVFERNLKDLVDKERCMQLSYGAKLKI